ncbi:MAG TPA: B3/4 domain-containing protein [Solirubrobacterales bacterium]|nr:B3/4 domain-containing protein [Solirubrobacterales bacterium]
MEAEAPLRRGWVEPALRTEFSGLGIAVAEVAAQSRRSPAGVKQRLKHLSDITHGGRALAQRREPIASAYRIFFRQIGIDPEDIRPPAEAAMLERMRAGRFKSRNTVDDAITVALVETGVYVRAFDAAQVQGDLGLRVSVPGERLGGDGLELPGGTLVIADEQRAIGLIFGDTAPGRGVSPDTRRMALGAVQVPGVPDISVEEAMWICSDILTSS